MLVLVVEALTVVVAMEVDAAVVVVMNVVVGAVVAVAADVVVNAAASVVAVGASVEMVTVVAIVEMVAVVAIAVLAAVAASVGRLLGGEAGVVATTTVPVQVVHHFSPLHMLLPPVPSAQDMATEETGSPL